MTTFLKAIPRIHIHPILLVFIVLSFFTGTFLELSIILLIVLFHELGHYTVATYYKWRIKSLMLWVFGGVMDTDEHGSRPIREEFLVTIAGPIQHIIIYAFLFMSYQLHNIPHSILELVLYYNTVILIFNLLPIWPLDGGKIIFYGISLFMPFKKAYYFVIILSICFCSLLIISLFFYPFTFSAFLILIFLLAENKKEWKQRYYVFIRFLLNRYEGKHEIKKIHPLTVSANSYFMDLFSLFWRQKKHPIFIETDQVRVRLDENDCLHYYFKGNNHHQTVGDAFIEKEA